MAEHVAVRRDLWTAMVDHSSGKVYCWNGTAAAPVEPPVREGAAVLPTVTAEQFAQWKRDFANAASGHAGAYARRQLRLWTETNAPAFALLPRIRAEWNAFLRDRVVDHLIRWFHQRGIAIPDDLLVRVDAASSEVRPDAAEALRQAVLSCVRQMSYQELLQLRIPASALVKFEAFVVRRATRSDRETAAPPVSPRAGAPPGDAH